MRYLLALALSGAVALTGCDGDPGPRFGVKGRLSFGEPSGCSGAVGSQTVSWKDCHAFKRHFDPATGQKVTSDTIQADSMRPLPIALELAHYEVDEAGNTLNLCDRAIIQTDLEGTFNTSLKRCPTPGRASKVFARATLQYTFTQASGGHFGTVHAVWPEEDAIDLFDGSTGEVTSHFTFTATKPDATGNPTSVRYAVPELNFTYELNSDWKKEELNLGNRVFLGDAGDDSFNYMRQVLSAWTTMVELHDRVRRAYNDSDAYYAGMFITDPWADWDHAYTIWFDNTWAYGWRGGIALHEPDLDLFEDDGGISPGVAYVLSSVGTLSHEMGHGVHGAFAAPSFLSDYSFAFTMRRADGTTYDQGHSLGQYQELGTAFTEGMASSIGQSLVNRCAGAVPRYRPLGGATPFSTNLWSANFGCDATDGCGSHYVRWHLNNRSVMENSAEWVRRVTALQDLTAAAINAGHEPVVSNNEGRYSEFGCDLLDEDKDVSHATGRVNGLTYLPDFTYHVSEILDGRVAAHYATATYGADPGEEKIHLTLPELMNAMARFCPNCSTLPGGSSWGEAYGRRRISALQGDLSPQALGKYLVSQGQLTDEQLGDLLRSNFMEDGI